MELDIGYDLFLTDPVHLVPIGLRVEGLLVDERFDQALLALLDQELALLADLLELLDRGLPVLPDLEDRLSQGLKVLGLRLQLVQELEEQSLESVLGDAHARAARAAVVGVASPSLAARPAPRQGPFASCAAHEAAQGEVGVVPVVTHLGGADSREDSLNAVEEGRLGQGLEVGLGIDPPVVHLDPAGIDRVLEHAVPGLRRDTLATLGAEPLLIESLEDRLLGVQTRAVELEAFAHEGTGLWVDLERGRAVGPPHVSVTQGRLKGPAASGESFLHAHNCLFRPNIVVELGDRREHSFHQLACRALVDRLRHRSERDSELGQQGSHRVVGEVAAREAVERVDHHDLELAAVLATVSEKLLQLGSVCGLSRLSALDKDPIDLPALVFAESSAGLPLGLQAQVLGLLLGRDSAVDDGSHQLASARWSTLEVSSCTVVAESVSEARSTTSSARVWI